MKKTLVLSIATVVLLFASSCKKYLDINKNPNAATSTTPEALLPQAIVYTAANVSSYNDYGAELAGFAANAGGYGGFGSNWTYDFGPNDYSGLWSSTFDVLNDLQVVLNLTANDSSHAYFNAYARIMKVYNYQMLIDTYNDVPYSAALQGIPDLTPKYDDAKTIYPQLALQLDTAISIIENEGPAFQNEIAVNSGTDPMFAGDQTSWIQFANTLKLRLIIRASSVISFANTTFDSHGFLSTDAIVNPGYAKISGQQNPSWNTWVQTYAGANGNRAWMPCVYAVSLYDGTVLTDNGRGGAIYNGFPNVLDNQLGIGTTAVPSAVSATNGWYTGDPNSLGNVDGVMKGLNMGEPILMASESYFLQSEATLRNIIPGGTTGVDSLFDLGVESSFNYIYLLPDDKTLAGDPVGDFAQYQSDNSTSYLVNIALATTPDQQLEAIITQKYIALNFINSSEAWNEYRRTGYPRSSNFTADPTASFASVLSQSSRPDHLPTRILYPASEYSYNAANVPTGVSPYTSLIFWAK